jgi:HK97 family phage major capsid protein
MIQTPPKITTADVVDLHNRVARASMAPAAHTIQTKKTHVYGSDFFLRSSYEILDTGKGQAVENHRIIQRATGINPRGGMLVSGFTKDLTTVNTEFVQTTVDKEARPSFVQQGVCGKATIFTDLKGDFTKPYFATSASPLSAPTEGSAPSDSTAQTLGALTLKPFPLAFTTKVSRQVAIQSAGDILAAAQKDAARVANSNLDGLVLGGLSLTNAPTTGILTSSVNPSSGNTVFSQTNHNTVDLSSAITNVKLSNMVEAVEATLANDDGTFLFVTSPTGASTLRTTSVGGASARFLVANNFVLGDERLRLATSQYLAGVTGNLIFGRFSDLAIGLWAVELTVDPYTQMDSGNILLNWILWCSFGLLHGPSFVVGTGGSL